MSGENEWCDITADDLELARSSRAPDLLTHDTDLSIGHDRGKRKRSPEKTEVQQQVKTCVVDEGS